MHLSATAQIDYSALTDCFEAVDTGNLAEKLRGQQALSFIGLACNSLKGRFEVDALFR